MTITDYVPFADIQIQKVKPFINLDSDVPTGDIDLLGLFPAVLEDGRPLGFAALGPLPGARVGEGVGLEDILIHH